MKLIWVLFFIFQISLSLEATELFITNSNPNLMNLVNWNAVTNSPVKSAGILIDNLATIDQDFIEWTGSNYMNSITYLAALRVLTGTGFTARTSYQFVDQDDGTNINMHAAYIHSQLLNRDYNDKVAFFRFWRTRYRFHLAPLDAQKGIIQKWKNWYALNGKRWKYNLDKSFYSGYRSNGPISVYRYYADIYLVSKSYPNLSKAGYDTTGLPKNKDQKNILRRILDFLKFW